MDEIQLLKARIEQLEKSLSRHGITIPREPDPTLATDEWYAIFSDYKDLTSGAITKIPWSGGSNATSTFKVKRVY